MTIMKKIIFFDLDNTIYSTKRGMFHPNTLKMLEVLSKRKDVELGLATGRAPHKVPMLKAVKKYFKYFVYINGALAFNKNRLVLKNALDKCDIQEVVKYAKEKNVAVGLVGLRDEYVTFYDEIVMKGLKGFNDHKPLIYDETCFYDAIFQLWVFSEDRNVLKSFHEKFDHFVMYPWHVGGADLTKPSTNKIVAIKELLKYEKKHQLITVGDGFNDLEMIKYADIGVAMNNTGFDILKQNANFIAPHIEEDKLFAFLVDMKII